MQRILLIGFFLIYSELVLSQTIITGIVRDRDSKELLSDVLIKSGKLSVNSNKYGYFSIIVMADSQKVKFSCIGYETIFLTLQPKIQNEVLLSQGNISLKGIEVKGNSNTNESITLSPKKIATIPVIFGEPDVLKSLTIFPGVLTGREGTSGLFIRGGTPDQNLIVLDEAIVYNSNHLFGFISTFNPDAIQRLTLHKSYFPIEYGGRLSSVIDLTMKEGSKEKVQANYTIGLINTRFLVEGPISNNSSFLLAGRTSYLGLIGIPFFIQYKNNKRENYANYWMYDLNAKYNIKFNNNGQIFFSYFHSKDSFLGKSKNEDQEANNSLNWKNQSLSIRYIKPIISKIFTKSVFTASSYSSGFNYKELLLKMPLSNFNANSSLKNMSFKQLIDFYLKPNLILSSGVDITNYKFTPSEINTSFNYNKELLEKLNQQFFCKEYSYFFESIFNWQKIQTKIGVRNTLFVNKSSKYKTFQPRFQVNYSISNDFNFSFGVNKGNQNLHYLSNNTGISNDIWVPSSDIIKPQQVLQFDFSLNKKLTNDFLISLSIFKKSFKNQIEFTNPNGFLTNYTKFYEENIQTMGIGKTSGIELLLEKTSGKMNGNFGLTLMTNRRKFESINNGEWYPSNFDKPFNLVSNINYKINKKYQLNTLFNVSSGVPFNNPEIIYRSYFRPVGQTANYFSSRRNYYRLPMYHRVDVSLSKNFVKHGQNQKSITFGVYNVFFSKNVFFTEYAVRNVFKDEMGQFTPVGFEGKLKGFSIFPFIPYFNFSKTIK